VTLWTIRGQEEPVKASPGLLYHKWHAYDHDFATKESRLPFLERVAESVNAEARGKAYEAWCKRYGQAVEDVGFGVPVQTLEAQTVWRLVVGFATNPALETGITLHPLLGFPFIPGSAVRGLARRLAEYRLTEKREAVWNEWLAAGQLPPDGKLNEFLTEAECVKALLGSLIVENLEDVESGWTLPRQWEKALRNLLADRPEDDPVRRRVNALFGEHTGGLLTFYDAVPLPGQDGLLQTDILNPHYPDYYRDPGSHPPSDDQNPVPVYFLAVKPAAAFVFRFRLGPLPQDWPHAGRETLEEEVKGWLRDGLETWGAGGKTAAGYGYFQTAK
jgi:CRISPR-associated protein Cmr6